MRRGALVLLGSALCILSSCSSPPSTGTVHGVFETIGGPAGHGPHLLPGRVVFSDGNGANVSVKVGARGTFSVN